MTRFAHVFKGYSKKKSINHGVEKKTWVGRTVVNQDRLVNGGKENEMQKILWFCSMG